MGIRRYNPTTPGRRGATVSDFAELTPGAKPVKSLMIRKRKKGGRNNQGVITSRHRGGGHKQHYRLIDFRRNKDDIPAVVNSIQYDPNRSARIALLYYADGEKRYILAPEGLKAGDKVLSGKDAPAAVGNCLPLSPSPWDWTSTTSKCNPAAAECCAVRRGCGPLWRHATPIGRKSTCPAAKSAVFQPRAGQPSAASAIPITWVLCWARRDENAGWAAARTFAARP